MRLQPAAEQTGSTPQQGSGRRTKPAWAESWSRAGVLGQRQEALEAASSDPELEAEEEEEEEGGDEQASIASSPCKSALPRASQLFLEAADQPLSRLTRRRHITAPGSPGSDMQSPPQRGPTHGLRPSSPPVSREQYDQWVREQRTEEGGGAGTGGSRRGSGTDGGSSAHHRTLFGGRAGGSALSGYPAVAPPHPAAAPSDPMTYHVQAALDKESLPNLGDVQDDSHFSQWHIPAVRGGTPSLRHGGAGYGSLQAHTSLGGLRSGKRAGGDNSGAAVKLGRRRAWLKFLAYEGCTQICLDQLLGGDSSTPAREFLEGGCAQLKGALGFDQLLLAPQPAASADGGMGEGAAIYWDDKDVEGTLPSNIECADMAAPEPQQQPLQPPLQQQYMLPMAPSVQQPAGDVDSGGYAAALARHAQQGAGHIEVTVMRVVGCDLLGAAATAKSYFLALYPGRQAAESGAWTLISSDGSAHNQEQVQLAPEAAHETLVAELHDGTRGLASGSIQVAELHKIAMQPDLLDDSPGFFKSLLPWSRKGACDAHMAWLKLVDEAGRTCGHAVLSARVATGLPSDPQGLMGPPALGPPAGMHGMGPLIEEVHTLSLGVEQQLALVPRLEGAPKQTANVTAGGYIHITPLQVYDELLGAALKAQGCGPRALPLQGPWRWLLDEFAAFYGVRGYSAQLSYLKWMLRPDNATVTADCFELVCRELAPLKQAQLSNALSSGELGVLAQVALRMEELLTTSFENYFMLSEAAATGMMDGALSVRSGIPPVLQPAVELFRLLRDESSEGDQRWLAERFKVAARKRYQGLLTATELQRPTSPRLRSDPGQAAEPSAEAGRAYARMEELCKAVMNELRADDQIAATAVLPACVQLPQLTSLEYVKGIIKHLGRVLAAHPPPAPTEGAIRLVESVGKLQDFVARHGYGEASARLNSRDIFGHFVKEWIAGSSSKLRALCRQLEVQTPAVTSWQDFGVQGKHRVSPLVEEMVSSAEREMRLYRRIIMYWPMYGPDLEKAVTGALRDATLATSRRCGLVQTKEAGGSAQPSPDHHLAMQPCYMQRPNGGSEYSGPPPATSRGGRTGWRWLPTSERGGGAPPGGRGLPPALHAGITPPQALLLNSLRRLLAVAPNMEHDLAGWCGGGRRLAESGAGGGPGPAAASGRALSGRERIARDAPDLGAHYAQLVKELRSEYFAAITLCAERLALELARAPPTSVVAVLRRDGLYASQEQLTEEVVAVLCELERLLQWLSNTLEQRVFVALCRGLWDLTAKDVLEYAEELQEGGAHGGGPGAHPNNQSGVAQAWRGRQSASAAVRALDDFFRGALTASMGNDLQGKDLSLPQHSSRAHKLLAASMSTVNMSYDVY